MNSKLERLEEAADKFKEVCEDLGVISFDKLYIHKNHKLIIYPQIFMQEENYVELFGKTEPIDKFRETMYNGIRYRCLAGKEKKNG